MFNFIKSFFKYDVSKIFKHINENRIDSINQKILLFREEIQNLYLERQELEDKRFV